MTSYASYIVETLVTLTFVSALAFLVLFGARRVGVGRATGAIDLVGRVPIDSRRSVVLVRVANQVYVVGVSEAGLTKLGEVAALDLPPPVDAAPLPFAAVLRAALGRGKSGPGAEAGT